MIDQKLLKERRSRRFQQTAEDSSRPSSAGSSASTSSTPISSTDSAVGTKISMTWAELEESMKSVGETPNKRASKKAALRVATPESSFTNLRGERPPLSASAKKNKSTRSVASDAAAANSSAHCSSRVKSVTSFDRPSASSAPNTPRGCSQQNIKIYMTSDDLSKSVAAAERSTVHAKNRSLDREALRRRRAKMLKEQSRSSLTPRSLSSSRSIVQDDDSQSTPDSSLKARIQSGILRSGTTPASKQKMTCLEKVSDDTSGRHDASKMRHESTKPATKNLVHDLEGESGEKGCKPSLRVTQKSRDAAANLAMERARAKGSGAESRRLGATDSGPKQITPIPATEENLRKQLIELGASSQQKSDKAEASGEPKASATSSTPTTRTPLKQLPLSVRREQSQREERRRSRQRSPSQTETRRNLDKRTARVRYSGDFRAEIEKYRRQQLPANSSSSGSSSKDLDPYRREQNGISVFVRKRPLFDYERERNDYDVVDMDSPGYGDDDYDRVTVHNCTMHADMKRMFLQQVTFPCSAAFDDSCSNDEIFDQIADPLVKLAANGSVATILMYGQTGSGKTHTMTGIEERTANRLFDALKEREDLGAPRTRTRSGESPEVTLQCVELSGKSCKDLLGRGDEVQLADEKDGTVRLVNATSAIADSPKDLARLFAKAKCRRATEATDANGVSSRSHAVCQIGIRFGNRRKRGLLTLIDLAGSERNKDSMYHSSQRQKESAEINASLFSLKNSIRARNNGEVIPYRSSLLTRLLRESFERDGAKLSVIATVAPNASDTEHSCETLKTVSSIVGLDSKIFEGEKNEVSQQRKTKPSVVPPRAWDHSQLVAFLSRKKIDLKVPENIDGKTAMRMNVQQIRARLCKGNSDDKLPTKIFNALRKENDRVDKIQRQDIEMKKQRLKRSEWENSSLYRR